MKRDANCNNLLDRRVVVIFILHATDGSGGDPGKFRQSFVGDAFLLHEKLEHIAEIKLEWGF